MSKEQVPGVALVGCGDIGWINAQALGRCKELKLAFVFDTDPALSQALARQLGVKVARSYEELLASPDVQLVFLSVPHHLHLPLSIQAAAAGKHLLVEKPLASKASEALEIISACCSAGVSLETAYSFRASHAVRQSRELVESGALGRPAGVSVHHMINKGRAYWNGGFSGRSSDNWRASRTKAGGGILIMGMVHSLDYMQHILGKRIVRVFSEYNTRSNPGDVEDSISLVCSFEDGAVGQWLAATNWQGPAVLEERIWGSAGSIVLKPEPGGCFLTERHGTLAPGKFNKFLKPATEDFRSAWLDSLGSRLIEGPGAWPVPRDSYAMTALIEAAYASRDSGRAIDVEACPLSLAGSAASQLNVSGRCGDA